MRTYETTHQWITFSAADLNDLDQKLWMLLGEARSKCEHLAGAPLQPDVARRLYEVTLVKGAQATTAIEGNTLTEEQVAGIYHGTYKAPTSRAYQEREVRNVIDALEAIDDDVAQGKRPTITSDLIRSFNARTLEGTSYDAHVVPGQIRQYSVGVGNYRGAPAEDCEYLLDRLCEWLESNTFRSPDPELHFALTVASAVYAHLYIAWIHPFGDGNGRTARLLEFLILARSGMVPLPAAHLLSNHYNLTRDQYYRELAGASTAVGTNPARTNRFVSYAVQGLVDGLREQIDEVRNQQFNVTWINHVHQTMGQSPSSPTRDRQRSLVLAMPSGVAISRTDMEGLTPKLAAMYAKAGPRTLTRDLNRLRDAGLIVKRKRGWMSNDSVIRAFLPPVADIQD